MRQIDNMTSAELDTLVLKGMLSAQNVRSQPQPERTGSAPITTKMPNTITLRKRIKDADKKHSVIFSTETSTDADKEIVDSIYFKRPFADGVKSIKLTIVRDIDATVDSL
jgi:hypothetical protein